MKELKTTNGETIVRLSRWIKIRTIKVSSRHPLFCYAEKDEQDENVGYVNYFVFHRKKYALGEFIHFNSPFMGEDLCYIENGKEFHLSGMYSVDYFDPIIVELDNSGEMVRVYKMKRKRE